MVVEKTTQSRPREIEVHRNVRSQEELQECAQKTFEGVQASLMVMYGADNVHENLNELRELEERARLGRMFNISNASLFESFLGNADYPMAVFFYSEPEHFNSTVTQQLGALSDSFLVAYVHSSVFVEYVSPQIKDVSFIREITTNPNFTDGALAMLPPGDVRHKLDGMVVFDEFSNLTNVMIQSSIRWAGERVRPLEPSTMEKEMMDSVQRDRIFAVFLIDPRVGMPFEFMMVAVNPRFWDLVDFRYYLGPDERVFQMLNVKRAEVPRLVLIHFGRESYKSREYFSMHPIEDPSKTGFRDFNLNLGIVNNVRSTHQSHSLFKDFLANASRTLVDIEADSLAGIDSQFFAEDVALVVLMDVRTVHQDEDIDYSSKREALRTALVRLQLRALVLNTTCYDDLDLLGMDAEELNLLLFDRKHQRVLGAELESLEARDLAKQLAGLKAGSGRKLKLQTVDRYLGSKDCSIGAGEPSGDL